MSVGLELGCTHFRSLRCVNAHVVSRQCPAVYLAVADNAGHRRLFDQVGAHYATCASDLVLLGEPALEWSDMLNQPVTRLLNGGKIPASDAVARQIVALMIDAVLPQASCPGECCCLILPTGAGLTQADQSYDTRFFQQVVSLRGYHVRPISSGLAIVLAELADAAFSGIGIVLDGNDAEFSVVHCGRELARYVIATDLADLIEVQRSGSMNSKGTWERSCGRLLVEIFADARSQLTREGAFDWLPQPLRMTCTGHILSISGANTLIERAAVEAEWPVKANTIRFPKDLDLVLARGCLIQAELDTPTATKTPAA